MTEDQERRLRWRAHVHVGSARGDVKQPPGSCYGSYETCGEHHAHDDHCGIRRLVCFREQDADLAALLAAYDAMKAKSR